jgi:hypothetical protein
MRHQSVNAFRSPPTFREFRIVVPWERTRRGGLGKARLRGAKRRWQVHQLFGDKLNSIIDELNETLAA